MEIGGLTAVIGLALLVIGPGSGIWVAMRALTKANETANARTIDLLHEIKDHLAVLNGRVGSSEGHIEGLESREGTSTRRRDRQ